MLLLELTTLSTSSRTRNLGITISDDDLIEVQTSINIDAITHLSQSPDNKKLTNIYLTSGAVIISSYTLDELTTILSQSNNESNTSSPLDKFNIH